MATRLRWLASSLFGAVTVVTAAAQPVLPLKPGLWEITTTTTMGGGLPAVEKAGLSPERRAGAEVVQAVMHPATDVSRTCLTRADLERGGFLPASDEECDRTVVRSTRRVLEMNVECSGEPSSGGTVTIEVLTPASVRAAIHATVTEDDRSMSLKITIAGRWLAADCGSPD